MTDRQNKGHADTHRRIDARAREILQQNDQGDYTIPTAGLYPYQWNWDSAFVATGFATFDIDRALRELETLFAAQWTNGFVPHIVFRADAPGYFPGPAVWGCGKSPDTSGISQPPVAASILRCLSQQIKESDHGQRIQALFPALLAWHRWFRDCRDQARTGLVAITHPWESGRDNSPEWDAPASRVDTASVAPYERCDLQHTDAAMRPKQQDYDRYIALVEYGRRHGWDHAAICRNGPFRVADVGINMIFLRANRDLLRLAEEFDETRAAAEITGWIKHAEEAIDALWDEEKQCYCSYDLHSGQHSGLPTSASFLCFYAGVGNAHQRACMDRHWRRIATRATFMLPSLDPEAATFDAVRYWRGPCWAMMNWLIAQGFEATGREDFSERLWRDTRTLIEQHGFFEYFCPLTGQGNGGNAFSWTAAVWLAWAGREAGRDADG